MGGAGPCSCRRRRVGAGDGGDRRLARFDLSVRATHTSVMKPAPFDYVLATSLDHALRLKAEHGDEARFLAGGQSLIPAMNFRLARPAMLIDINRVPELAGADHSGNDIRLGAMTRYCALERDGDFLKACPLFADALPHIAHVAIRNRGTV